MLGVESPGKLLQRKLESSAAREPGAMHTIAGAINVAAPDALKAQQNVAVELRPDLFQFIRKPNDGFCTQARDRSKRPLILRPFIRGDQSHLVPGLDDATREAFQVRFRSAGRRIAAPNKSESEFLLHTFLSFRPERSAVEKSLDG